MQLTRIYILVMLFSHMFINIFDMIPYLSYWDEIITMILLALFIYSRYKSKQSKTLNKVNCIVICLLMMVTIIGLIGNIIFGYMPNQIVIFKDIVALLKFFTVLICLQELELDRWLSESMNNKFFFLLKCIVGIQCFYMIFSQFIEMGMIMEELRGGLHAFKFGFGHPTFMVSTNVMLLILMQSAPHTVKNIKWYRLITIIIILSGLRTKGMVFVAVYFFIKYCPNWIRKNTIYFVMLGVITVLLFSFQKLSLYASWSTSPREVFYKESIELAVDSFPIGTGFGSFASHLSAINGSKLYNDIKVPQSTYENGELSAVFGDAGFPYYIAQFGWIGSVLILLSVLLLIYKTNRKIVPENEYELAPYLIWAYIAIGLTSEAILINIGVELATILAIVSYRLKEK